MVRQNRTIRRPVAPLTLRELSLLQTTRLRDHVAKAGRRPLLRFCRRAQHVLMALTFLRVPLTHTRYATRTLAYAHCPSAAGTNAGGGRAAIFLQHLAADGASSARGVAHRRSRQTCLLAHLSNPDHSGCPSRAGQELATAKLPGYARSITADPAQQ